jgi:hypothetical protein
VGFEGLVEFVMGIIACIAVIAVFVFFVGGFILRRFVQKWSVTLPIIYWLLMLTGVIIFSDLDLGGGPFWAVVPMTVGLPFTLLALVFAPNQEIGSLFGIFFVVVFGTLQYSLLGRLLDAIRKKRMR